MKTGAAFFVVRRYNGMWHAWHFYALSYLFFEWTTKEFVSQGLYRSSFASIIFELIAIDRRIQKFILLSQHFALPIVRFVIQQDKVDLFNETILFETICFSDIVNQNSLNIFVKSGTSLVQMTYILDSTLVDSI